MSDKVNHINDRDDNQDLNNLYNNVYALIEEELFLRMNPENYHDNFDIISEIDPTKNSRKVICFELLGGGIDNRENQENQMPGKFDLIRNSYNMDINTAIKGSIMRQRLYMKENSNM